MKHFYKLIIIFSFFVIQTSYADNLNQKKVFCKNDGEEFFIEFKENNKANFTLASYPFSIYENKVVNYELKELLGDSLISVGGIIISRTKLQILSLSGYTGKCKLVNKDLTQKIKKKFDKLQNKNKKKKELKF